MAICAMSLSSCATMAKWMDNKPSKHYRLSVTSNTKGLPVYVGEELKGYTPLTFYSNKAKVKYITVRNGEEYQTIKTKRRSRRSVYSNFIPLYTFIWGFAVDYGSGNHRIYKEHDYHFNL